MIKFIMILTLLDIILEIFSWFVVGLNQEDANKMLGCFIRGLLRVFACIAIFAYIKGGV